MNYALVSLSAAALGLIGVFTSASPARAHDIAVRCSSFGCDQIVCNFTGDRCMRFSDYDSRFPSFKSFFGRSDVGFRHAAWGGGSGFNRFSPHVVCDNRGGRCYPSLSPFWDYREYYRRAGYTWKTPGWKSFGPSNFAGGSDFGWKSSGSDSYRAPNTVYGSSSYRYDLRRELNQTDQLNSAQLDRRYAFNDYGHFDQNADQDGFNQGRYDDYDDGH